MFKILRLLKKQHRGYTMKHTGIVLLLSFSIFSCSVPATATNNDFTLGKVQSQLKEGMSSASVVELLGSPNIVTNANDGYEVWTYDKVSSEAKDGSAMGAGVVPGGRFLGIFGGSRSSKSNKNLTLTIRFTPEGFVDSFKYQSIKY